MDKIWIIWNPITRLKETEELESDLRNAKENPKDLAEIWAKYIQFELKKGDPVRIEFTYERATTQLCLNPSLWVQYLQWARKIKSSNVLSVAKRASRNCSWDADLWGRDWLFKFHQFKTNMKSPLTSSFESVKLLNRTNDSSIDAPWWGDLGKTQEKISKISRLRNFWKTVFQSLNR